MSSESTGDLLASELVEESTSTTRVERDDASELVWSEGVSSESTVE